jgi:hypothetical protein
MTVGNIGLGALRKLNGNNTTYIERFIKTLAS